MAEKGPKKFFALYAPWSLRWASRQWWSGRNRRPGRKKGGQEKKGRKRPKKFSRFMRHFPTTYEVDDEGG